MKPYWLLLIILVRSYTLLGQLDSSCYAYVRGTGYVYGSSMYLKAPLLKATYLLVNEKDHYPADSVDYFENDKGYFRSNTLSKNYGADFVLRKSSQDIEVYKICQYADGSDVNYRTRSANTLNYYKKNFCYSVSNSSPLRKLTYRNMLADLTDCRASMIHLRKSKNIRKLSRLFLLVGATTFFTSYQFYYAANTKAEQNRCIPFVVGGGIMIACTFQFNGMKDRLKMEALEVYKRN